jgi:hypothetical protein
MKAGIKSTSVDDVVKRSKYQDLGPKVIAVLRGIPKGNVVRDEDLRAAICVSKRSWWRYLHEHIDDGPMKTHRCYMQGRPLWGMPDAIDALLERGAVRVRRPTYDRAS